MGNKGTACPPEGEGLEDRLELGGPESHGRTKRKTSKKGQVTEKAAKRRGKTSLGEH